MKIIYIILICNTFRHFTCKKNAVFNPFFLRFLFFICSNKKVEVKQTALKALTQKDNIISIVFTFLSF